MSTLAADITELELCALLDKRYGEHINQGDTNRAVRRERCRRVIQRYGEADKADANGNTLAKAFERIYGEPLVLPAQHHHENGDGV